MRLHSFFVRQPRVAPVLALDPELFVAVNPTSDDRSITEAPPAVMGLWRANSGPFFTSDGQFAAFSAAAFTEDSSQI